MDMENRRVFQANLFAFILLVLYVFVPNILVPVFDKMNLSLPLYIVLPQIILLLLPTAIYFIVTRKSAKNTLKLNKIEIKSILIIVAIGLAAQPVAMFLSLITQFIFPNRIGQVVSSMNEIPLIVRLAIIALTPAICEEVTMRGVVLAGYDNISIKKAALMTGMFFGILHLDGNQLLYAFALGVLFAYLVRITGSILSSMICHFVVNGTQVLLSELASNIPTLSGKPMESTQNAGLSALTTNEIINAVFAYLIMAIIGFGIMIILMQKLKDTRRIRINLNVDLHERRNDVDIDYEKKPIKIMNWPVYAALLLYIIVIVGELIGI